MPATKKPRKQLAINLSGNSVYTEVEDGWHAHFPLMDVHGFGATREEAHRSLQLALDPVTNHGTPEQKAAWQEFCQNNIIEIEMTEEEERLEDETNRTAALLAERKGPHFRTLSPEDFDEAVARDTPTLVDFWAAWCQPCLHLVPVLEQFQTEVADRVHIASVDVEAHEALWRRFDLKGIPTMILFRSGEELGRVLGTRTLEDLTAEVEAMIV